MKEEYSQKAYEIVAEQLEQLRKESEKTTKVEDLVVLSEQIAKLASILTSKNFV